ncbi:hypothetical protein FACS18949_11980 [Clostridia bacterium]|nr:hypothetical protein FACS18949_11980 [Clostridia bacterium]
MAYEHGVNITENKTSLSTPVTALSGISIVVGTAPVHMVGGKVNEPILAYSYAEAVSALGYSDDWAKYTLCEVIYSHFVLYQVAPVVFVNTLDPAVNITHIAAASYDLADGKIKLPFDAVADSLTVKDAPGGSTVYVKGTDYDLLYTEDNLVIEVLPGGDIAADATALLLEFNVIDLTGFDKNDIIGGYDVNTKKSSGLELVDAVFPKFTIVPDIILAPGYSDDAEVAAVMAAKAASINGSFRANALIDGDTTTVRHYSDVPEWKNAQNITSKEQILLWPMVKLGDRIFHASVQAAALMAQVDTYNGGNPSESPSNKKLQANAAVLADGTEVYLDKPTANYLNSNGIVTALKVLISYNGDPSNPEHRDAVEQISAYSREAMRELNKMEERYR